MSDVAPITIAHGGEPRPVWAIAGLREGVTVRRIDLQPDEKHFGGDTMLFNGKVIGKSEQPIYAAARWLLANNAAAGCDTVATYRGETLSMHGVVGDLAKWTVVETKDGKPASLYLRPYRPFSSSPVAARTAETVLGGSSGISALERELVA
jgi:hypothetical protein